MLGQAKSIGETDLTRKDTVRTLQLISKPLRSGADQEAQELCLRTARSSIGTVFLCLEVLRSVVVYCWL